MPLFVQPHDCIAQATVAVIAPSGVVQTAVFEQGLEVLRQEGFRLAPTTVLHRQDRYLAGTKVERFAELARALLAPEIGIIWAARGGYGAAHLLPLLRERSDLLAACQSKWLVGFSDITVLHELWSQQGVVSLHAANVCQLAYWSKEAQQQLFAILRGTLRSGSHNLMPLRSATMPLQGQLVGGNLTVLASLCGWQSYDHWQRRILILEDIKEAPYRIDRSLTQLCMSGGLANVAAVILGQFTECGNEQQLDEVVQSVIPATIPIYSKLAVGHEGSSWPIPLGAVATLQPNGQLSWQLAGESVV